MKLMLLALVCFVGLVQADGDWQQAVDNIDLYHISELRVTLMGSKSAKTLPDKCKLLWRGISAKIEDQIGRGSTDNLYQPLVMRRLRNRLDNRPAFVKLWGFIDECVEVLSGNYKIPNETNCDEISAVAMRNMEIAQLKKRLSELENEHMALIAQVTSTKSSMNEEKSAPEQSQIDQQELSESNINKKDLIGDLHSIINKLESN